MPRPFWEENGYTTEWFYRQHQMRNGGLTDAELSDILEAHGEPARVELLSLARSGNFSGYAAALERGVLVPAKRLSQTDLFGGA